MVRWWITRCTQLLTFRTRRVFTLSKVDCGHCNFLWILFFLWAPKKVCSHKSKRSKPTIMREPWLTNSCGGQCVCMCWQVIRVRRRVSNPSDTVRKAMWPCRGDDGEGRKEEKKREREDNACTALTSRRRKSFEALAAQPQRTAWQFSKCSKTGCARLPICLYWIYSKNLKSESLWLFFRFDDKNPGIHI